MECWRLAAITAPGQAQLPPSPKKQTPFGPGPDPNGKYIPKAGQRGKNVQWVPSSPVVLDKMLDLASVTAGDHVIDPGSGDGRIAIRAAQRGARALGIEANPDLVTLSQHIAIESGVGDRATFCVGDFFEMDFEGATVITLFLRKDINIRLRSKILALPPGIRVVSNIFDMGNWQADETVKVEDSDYYFRNHTIRLWIVPAKARGVWTLPNGKLLLKQEYQMITGTLDSGSILEPVEGRLSGDRIRFTAGDRTYTGRIIGNRMVLETNDACNIKWIATNYN